MPVTEENQREAAISSSEMGESIRARGMRYWIPRVLTGILIPVVLIGLLEGVLRLFDVGFPTDATVPCTLKGQAASCYNLFFPAPFFPPGMIKTPQAYAIPASKPAGTYRIFVLGESAAMGDPDPAYAFSRYLEVILRKNYPQMNFEVINTGSVAVNSHVLLPLARGLAKQKPDLFIIYSGNNEVVGPYGPGTALTSSGMYLPVIRASIFARSSRVGQLLVKLGTQKKEWRGMEMFLDRQVPANSPLMKYAYSNFEANLRDTVEAARASGARVIVSTVATNLKDCAPFASMYGKDLNEAKMRSWWTFMAEATLSENVRAYSDAMKAYDLAAKIDDQYAELEFRMARTLWMAGDYASAREHFQKARDLDALRFRADSRINEINRSVAGSAPGAELVDAEEVFAGQSANRIIGSDLVYEHVHMTPLGNYLLARAMFVQIAKKMPDGHAVADADIPSEADCERLLALTPHDRVRIAAEMFQRLQKPPFTNQSNHADQLLRLGMQAALPDENPNQTALEYQWAIAQRPDDRVLHYNYGLFLFGYDRNASFAELKLAQPWDGFPVFAPDGTAVQ
jgi:tetratricopeptide (TPR) repeat protein